MNHIVLIGHGKMGSALAKGWVKENSQYKISIIEKEELLLNYKKFTNVKVYKNFNEFFTENKKMKNSETNYWQNAERTNGRMAMMGFFALVVNYGLFGWIIPGIF